LLEIQRATVCKGRIRRRSVIQARKERGKCCDENEEP
jgi:hypothetical protein